MNTLQTRLSESMDFLDKSIAQLRVARATCWADPKLEPAKATLAELVLQLMSLYNQLDLTAEELDYVFEHYSEIEVVDESY